MIRKLIAFALSAQCLLVIFSKGFFGGKNILFSLQESHLFSLICYFDFFLEQIILKVSEFNSYIAVKGCKK